MTATDLDRLRARPDVRRCTRCQTPFPRTLTDCYELLVVLEDMEPRWLHVLARRYRPGGLARRGRDVAGKLRAAWPGGSWPLQPDHLHIREADLHRWTRADFDVRRRARVGDYLTWEYVRRVARGA